MLPADMAAECESGAKDEDEDADADDEAEDKDEAPAIEAIEVGKKAWRKAACSGDEGA